MAQNQMFPYFIFLVIKRCNQNAYFSHDFDEMKYINVTKHKNLLMDNETLNDRACETRRSSTNYISSLQPSLDSGTTRQLAGFWGRPLVGNQNNPLAIGGVVFFA